VLTSTAPMMWGATLPELTQALPGVKNIELLIGGITTHVCLAFPAVSAVADGYHAADF